MRFLKTFPYFVCYLLRKLITALLKGNANIVKYCFMENKEQQILSEIKSMMASIRVQLERLDAKMAELQQVVDPEEFEAESIDLEIDEPIVAEQVVEEAVQEQEIPLVEEVEPTEEPAEEPVEETMEETIEDAPVEEVEDTVEDLPMEDLPLEEPAVEETPADDLPFFDEEPVLVTEPVPVTVAEKAESVAKLTVNDAMAAQQAWRKDMPGSQVRDIRSAISLNDRIIFINYLFREDPMAFQESLTKINQMESLDQVVEYVCTDFPEWDLNSEVVYRFMMAVRRKVR